MFPDMEPSEGSSPAKPGDRRAYTLQTGREEPQTVEGGQDARTVRNSSVPSRTHGDADRAVGDTQPKSARQETLSIHATNLVVGPDQPILLSDLRDPAPARDEKSASPPHLREPPLRPGPSPAFPPPPPRQRWTPPHPPPKQLLPPGLMAPHPPPKRLLPQGLMASPANLPRPIPQANANPPPDTAYLRRSVDHIGSVGRSRPRANCNSIRVKPLQLDSNGLVGEGVLAGGDTPPWASPTPQASQCGSDVGTTNVGASTRPPLQCGTDAGTTNVAVLTHTPPEADCIPTPPSLSTVRCASSLEPCTLLTSTAHRAAREPAEPRQARPLYSPHKPVLLYA